VKTQITPASPQGPKVNCNSAAALKLKSFTMATIVGTLLEWAALHNFLVAPSGLECFVVADPWAMPTAIAFHDLQRENPTRPFLTLNA